MSFSIQRFYRRFLPVLFFLLFLFIGLRVAAQENNTSLNLNEPLVSSAIDTPLGGSYCSTPNLPIPINNSDGVTDTIPIADNGILTDLNIQVVISHTWVSDLEVSLIHHDSATTATLVSHPGGGCSGDDMNVFLDDAATLSIQNDCQNDPDPAYGSGESYQPFENLSIFTGENLSGDWTLKISDDLEENTGAFESWCLLPTYTPTQAAMTIIVDAFPPDGTNFQFTSDLPGEPALDASGIFDRDLAAQNLITNTFSLDDAIPDDGDSITDTLIIPAIPPGSYIVEELLPDENWHLNNISCDSGSWSADQDIHTLAITLAAGEDVTCTFSNLTSSYHAIHLPIIQKPGSHSTMLIPSGAEWKYLDNGSDQGNAWHTSSFDDSAWSQGIAELGYGDGDETTFLGYGPNPLNKYITAYFRHTFTVTNLSEITMLDFHLLRDDGAVVYLNGQEVIRSNMPAGPITYQTLAPITMGLVGETMWNPYLVEASGLVPGTNVIAVEIHQNAANSSDISFDLSLTGLTGAFEEAIRFAAIGDYGKNTPEELAVATLVESWAPDFVITLGDNNYPAGEQTTIEENIDAYYGDFIENTFETTRFFPSLGNHDWGDEDILSITCIGSVCEGPYLDHFDLPGNERYYDFVKGPVHFFVLDSDPHEPDGNTMTSLQATWLQNQLASANEPWKVVYFHHPPYSSGEHGNHLFMQWPFEEWGASLVLSGHDHNYERLIVDGFSYFVNGSGGANLRPCGVLQEGSQICYDTDHGAMIVIADFCHMTLTFTTPTNIDIDAILLENNQCH